MPLYLSTGIPFFFLFLEICRKIQHVCDLLWCKIFQCQKFLPFKSISLMSFFLYIYKPSLIRLAVILSYLLFLCIINCDFFDALHQSCDSLDLRWNNIFVAFPSAAFSNASSSFIVRTASSAPASFRKRIPSAFACCTFMMASALPSASRIVASFCASAFRIAACFSASASRIADSLWPSATRIVDFFSPSARKIASRRSRSASSASPLHPGWLPVG